MGDKNETSGSWMSGAPHIDRRHLLKGGALIGAELGGIGFAPRLLSAARADTPKKGGTLRVAMTGGAPSDTVDVHNINTQPDQARIMALYEGLTGLDLDSKVINVLAESFEPNATATEFVVRLRKGVKFHNGKDCTAADVAFSLRRIADPKSPRSGLPALGPLDLANMKVEDDRTLRIPMKTPYAAFPEAIAVSQFFGIVPSDYDPAKPVGTGAFKFQSFSPGQQSVFTRFDDYWGGPAYLDSVVIIDSFQSDTAAFNALQGGEVDVYSYATLTIASQIAKGSDIKTLVSSGLCTPLDMRIDAAPFDNPDVRMAFRLLVDRQQMVDQSLNGFGTVGNDVFSPQDPDSDRSLKRVRDIDKAKFLLNKAGAANLAVELVTADFSPGVLQGAQVFAQQAKDAGVTINIKQLTIDQYYVTYPNWPFCSDYWQYYPYLSVVAFGLLPSSPWNASHWKSEPYEKLYAEAIGTLDASKRTELVHEMQRLEFDQGGLIIPTFNNLLDLLATNVMGFKPSTTGNGLSNFNFAKVWLAD